MSKNFITNILIFLSRTDIFCYLLLWLIIIITLDTIAQKDLGIYAAQQKYFSAKIIWIGKLVPLPGGNLTIIILFICLLIKLIITRVNLNIIGTTIVHIGSLLLLMGSFITGYFSKEGSMVIYEGNNSNYFSDVNKMELAITKVSNQNNATKEIVFNENYLVSNTILTDLSLPLTLHVNKYYKRCILIEYSKPLHEGKADGMARFFTIQATLNEAVNNDETNAGLLFTTSNNTSTKIHLITEHMVKPYKIEHDGIQYLVCLRHAQTSLPFYIYLTKFTKQTYPGTNNPKKYESSVIIKDGTLRWESNIAMNKPLRYKGYTFYQASFVEGKDNQASIFAVVKNVGRLLPYISSIIIYIGILIHIIQKTPKLLPKNKIVNKNLS